MMKKRIETKCECIGQKKLQENIHYTIHHHVEEWFFCKCKPILFYICMAKPNRRWLLSARIQPLLCLNSLFHSTMNELSSFLEKKYEPSVLTKCFSCGKNSFGFFFWIPFNSQINEFSAAHFIIIIITYR